MKDRFESLFEQDFDSFEPTIGHFERFEKRLAKQQPKKTYRKWIFAAASVFLVFGFFLGTFLGEEERLELAHVSPEMEKTQRYFTSVIQMEVEKIGAYETVENKKMIKDAFLRLEALEKEYSKLTYELKQSEEDKRVIFVMISNFQYRIEILQNLVQQLEKTKQFKNIQI